MSNKDGKLRSLCRNVVENNPKASKEASKGNKKAQKHLYEKVMDKTNGKANKNKVKNFLKKEVKNERVKSNRTVTEKPGKRNQTQEFSDGFFGSIGKKVYGLQMLILSIIPSFLIPGRDYYNPNEDFEWVSLDKDDETVLYWTQPSYYLLLDESIFLVIALILSIIVSAIGSYITGILLILLIPIPIFLFMFIKWMQAWMKIRFKFYVLTNYKLIEKKGLPWYFLFLSYREVNHVMLKDIANIESEKQGLEIWLEKIDIDIEDIIISIKQGGTGQQGGRTIKERYMADSNRFKSAIYNAKQETSEGMTMEDEKRMHKEAIQEAMDESNDENS